MFAFSSPCALKKLWKESRRLHRQLRLPRPLRPPPVDAFQQHRQLRPRQRNRAARGLRPNKAPTLQSLREQTQPVAVIPENLDQIASPTAKHEDVSRKWLLLQLALHQR